MDPQLAELAAQSGGRLDAGAWQAMQQAANTETQSANAERMAAREQYQAAQRQARMAERQSLTDRQRDEAMLLEGNTSMSEAAVNVAARAMPEGVGGEVYSVAANTVYQMARQGIAEDWDTALDLAGRYGVRVNQVLAAPGGAEALQMVYNQGQMDGIEAAGYGAAGLADERQAGQVEYQPGALVPEEDRALFDLYAAASDTAVTVSERLERNAGGYVDTALGKVYFGAQAGADTFGTILHESVHQYNAWDEAGGRELQTATLRYMAEQSGFESVNELVESYIQRYQEAGQELSYAQACEEITADAMRGVFGSEEAFGRWVEHQRALAGQNSGQRSAVARVMDKVRGMLDKVIEKAKSILAREPDNAAAKQAQALAENQKRTLEELYYKHAETAMEAQRAAREGGTESETFNSQSVESGESSEQNLKNEAGGRTAAEARRQYQLREKAGRGQYPQAGWTGKENAAYETLTALPDMEITEIDSRKVRRRHSVNEVMDDAFANMGAGRDAREATVTNRYTGMEVTVSRKGIRHSFHKHEDINERGPYVQQIGSILKNAVKVNELDKRTGPKSRGEDYSDVYLGAARNEKGELVGVRLIVNVYENGKAELDLDSVEPTGNLHGHVGTKIGDAEASPNRAPAAHWQNSQRSATRRTVSGTVVQGPRASTAEAEPSHIVSIAYEGRQVNGAGTKIGDADVGVTMK